MKKVFALIIFSITLLLLAGCSSSGEKATSSAVTDDKGEQSGIVGLAFPDTSEPFLAMLSNSVKELLEKDGFTVQIANAAGDAATQINQIENFASMKADVIVVMAVDPTSIGDVLTRAQQQGSLVLSIGSDTGVYDALMYTDQYEDGTMMAEMARDWIAQTYPDAKENSIEVAILESRDTPEASKRSDGIATIDEISPAANVVKVVGGIKNNSDAQAAMENLIQTNPDVKVVLTYNSGGGLGANAFVMRPGSPVSNKAEFAVFASDVDDEILQAVKDSENNESVLRGVIKFGSNDLPGDTYNLIKKMLNEESYEKLNPDPLTKITSENIDEFLQ